MNISVVTVSDSCVLGTRIDEGGPCLIDLIKSSKICNAKIVEEKPFLVDDNLENIQNLLLDLIKKSDVVLTTGGTGFTKRDVTPEATLNVIERRCTGLEVALHTRSLQATPMAALSRSIAGIKKETLIVNFPGNVKAVKEYWEVLEPILTHGIDLLKNDGKKTEH